MESINSVAQTASKYIWGDKSAEPSHTEPLSGETGKGTKTDPYDAGNKEEEESVEPTSKSISNPTSDPLPTNTATSNSTSNLVPEKPKSEKLEHSSEPKKIPDVPTIPKEQNEVASHQPVQTPKSAEQPADTPSAPQPDVPSEKPNEEADLEVLKKRDPNDHSGEPMHVHDGGEHKSEVKTGDMAMKEDDNEETKKKKAEEKGTGEKWVKTSGVAAEGGDFDATKPGAGREADRLLEQKGVRKGDASDDGGPVADAHGSSDVKKPSKTQKLKEKLHIGSGKHT